MKRSRCMLVFILLTATAFSATAQNPDPDCDKALLVLSAGDTLCGHVHVMHADDKFTMVLDNSKFYSLREIRGFKSLFGEFEKHEYVNPSFQFVDWTKGNNPVVTLLLKKVQDKHGLVVWGDVAAMWPDLYRVRYDYFSFESKPLQPVSSQTLASVIPPGSKSAEALGKHNLYRNAFWITLFSGFAVSTYGFFTSFKKTESGGTKPKLNATFWTGVGISGISVVPNFVALKYLKKAVREFGE